MWRNIESTLKELTDFIANIESLVFFDTETTGLKNEDSIIQLSAVHVNKSFEELGRFDKYSNPFPNVISDKITEITGITNEMVKDAAPEREVLEDFFQWADYKKVGYLAYNAGFDKRMTESSSHKYGKDINMRCFDVLKFAKDVLVDGELENFKLATVAEYLNVVPEDAHFHSSMFDVDMTVLIFRELLRRLKITPPESQKGKLKPMVYCLNPWYKGKTQRLYITTALGTVYYDRIKSSWGSKDADLESIDMSFVEKQATELAVKNGYPDLSKVKEAVKRKY